MKKQILSVLLAINLFATETGIIENCKILGEQEFSPIADERGNMILTKKEFTRECTLTKKVQGACIKWETKTEEFVTSADDYDAYKSRNHEGSMGAMLAMIGAYDQIEHLWSGWKGYCEVGTKTNFDWASDPMFWAGLMMSTIMDGSAKGSNGMLGQGSDGFLSGTSFGEGVQGFSKSSGELFSSYFGETVGNYMKESAGSCLMAAGFNMGRDLYSSLTTSESDDMCDPVDEFCGDKNEQTDEGDIITMDRQQYDDLIAQHPEYAQYIVILEEQDGVLSVRYKKANEMANANLDNQEEMDKLKDEMKKTQILINVGITSGKLVACLGTQGAIGSSADTSDRGSDAFSAKNGISTAVSAIPAQYLGPYGALIKAALQVLVNFLYSFKDIDSCHDVDDADEAGARHAKTNRALPHDLCYFVYDQCVDNCGDAFLGLAKELRGYNYCCFDQILTKVLVVQIKAQLGRDWSHCTGVTLRDLNFVSFKQCSPEEMKTGIDGGKEGLGNKGSDKNGGMKSAKNGGYDPMETFQYKNKCIDLTEFKEYLTAQIGDDIDLEDFNSIFDDVKGRQ